MTDEEIKKAKEEMKHVTFEASASIYIIEEMLIKIRGMGEKTINIFPLEGIAIKQLVESYKQLESEFDAVLSLETKDK